ncbi:peptidoglycan DD-metalloendopeptidase family protein [Neolewinella aurantiaca]|uniref:Peptidoglycan DD-metalloendopeptidase family protein n=1 Tax=Neolewinella aurantiaca TaxID=2602767 RepID=A0A5C7FRJ1_9BACT|nr:peptidoglycan DD-metalloendopeptidase family protein [Neolewinella aurantiaca]TXF88731.1 peptidoglycan DD-metalloendopeptidase family protein [Neolewinella aurantiaca]
MQKELRQTNQRLAATQARRGAAVGQASLLRQQIEQRTELLETLHAEADRNAARLHRDSNVVVSLSEDLDRMGEEYGSALRAANRARLSNGWLAFMLNASGFNDAFRRAIYLRQYREYRRRQARLIQQTRASLNERIALLEEQRIEQDSLLYAVEDQAGTLREELVIQTAIVNKLSSSEKSLLAEVRKQQQQSERLNQEIRAAISRAIARDERKTRTDRKTGVVASMTNTVGGSINKRKGKLGWPVRGKIVRRFGTQPHPDVPSVKIQNSGIDIDAGASESVEAVFAGEVISLREIPGLHNVIMIRHGGYYTVYSNIEHPQISKGEQVQAGQQLGLTTAEGDALHFEIWKGKTPLNPASWLIR